MRLFEKKWGRLWLLGWSLVLFAFPLTSGSASASTSSPAVAGQNVWAPLIERLAADGLDRAEMEALFKRSELRYDPEPMHHKMRSLYETMFGRKTVRAVQRNLARLGYKVGPLDGRYGPKTRQAILTFQKKAGLDQTGLPDGRLRRGLEKSLLAAKIVPVRTGTARKKVYSSALSKDQLNQTRRYLVKHKPLLSQVRQKYGVPEEIAVGILTVETKVGTYLGRKKALTTLASMALCSDFNRVSQFFTKAELSALRKKWLKQRAGEKSQWAYNELKALLSYARTNRADPLSLVGSIYGAIGISQFMPTNALKFGMDGDGDGRVDLFRHEDAVHSLGAYLRGHGWQKKMTRAGKRKVLHAYNHSQVYVNTVLAVADYLTRTAPKKSSSN